MSDRTISILGCGWLGLPLARHLIALGYTVKGSTTTKAKLSLLAQSMIDPFLLTAGPALSGEGAGRFFQSHHLVLTIPFRRRMSDPDEYRRQIEAVIAASRGSAIKHVLFTSSTSIYPAGLGLALEDEPFTPDTPRSQTLWAVERLLLGNPLFKTTVIRFAGMYGAKRQIGRLLAGRQGVEDADSPVNLIHLDDCTAILTKVIQSCVQSTVLNACSDGHPTRKEIYTEAARHYGWEPPAFSSRTTGRRKIVSNAKLKKTLKYSFLHPDPMRFDTEKKREGRT